MAYLYRHIREDLNVPFYVGIGSGTTGKYKRAHSDKDRNKWWRNITAKTDYRVEIMFEHECYEFIKKKEIEFIKLYGRRDLGEGTLCNLTSGGEGCLGMRHSEETKKKVGAAHIGKVISKRHRAIISKFHKGKTLSKETRKKISLSQKGEKHWNYGKKRSEEAKRKTSIANRGEGNPKVKLTSKEVLEIRRLYKTTKISHRELAKKFNVSKSSIGYIVNRDTWKHI